MPGQRGMHTYGGPRVLTLSQACPLQCVCLHLCTCGLYMVMRQLCRMCTHLCAWLCSDAKARVFAECCVRGACAVCMPECELYSWLPPASHCRSCYFRVLPFLIWGLNIACAQFCPSSRRPMVSPERHSCQAAALPTPRPLHCMPFPGPRLP